MLLERILMSTLYTRKHEISIMATYNVRKYRRFRGKAKNRNKIDKRIKNK
jgi:transposase